jgi:hypothetical protein
MEAGDQAKRDHQRDDDEDTFVHSALQGEQARSQTGDHQCSP